MRLPVRFSRAVLALCSSVALTTACSSLPMSSDPRALRQFTMDSEEASSLAPQPGREPDLLLRDFYTASARPNQDYEAARAYLAASIQQEWSPSDSVNIVDRLDITPTAVESDTRREFQVNATIIGDLSMGGAYVPDNSRYEAVVVLEQIDGEWRITGLPDGVLFERTELRNHYESVRLFYPSPSLETVVAEQRWIYVPQSSSDTVLISLLLRGPSSLLAPAVRTDGSANGIFNGVVDDGVYSFGGFADATEKQRMAFAAQVVWTLSSASIAGPYSIRFEGTSTELTNLTTDDVANYNSAMTSTTATTVYALRNGSLLRLGSEDATAVDGYLGSSGRIQSVDVRSDSLAAIVQTKSDNQAELAVGQVGDDPTVVVDAETLSRPSFEANADALWTVADGRSVLRLVRSGTEQNTYTRAAVEIDGLDDVEGDISVLRLSYDGVRVAMIINGELYTGVVSRDASGMRRVQQLIRIAPQLGSSTVTVDWQTDGSLLVGTTIADTPVWRVEQDGSSSMALPSGNVIAPVVSVTAANNTMFLTDAVSIRQLSSASTSSESFWREIPGLRGQRAVALSLIHI